MDKIIVQITSGRGPIECCRAVARVQEMMLKQCKAKDIEVSVLDSKKADMKWAVCVWDVILKLLC